MHKTCLAGFLAMTILAGCGGSARSNVGYGAHCFQFRERHLLVLHRTYVLRFYYSNDFYRYLRKHRNIQYRRVSCRYFRG